MITKIFNDIIILIIRTYNIVNIHILKGINILE